MPARRPSLVFILLDTALQPRRGQVPGNQERLKGFYEPEASPATESELG